MKLNVGCGMFPVEGWVNTDMNPVTSPHPNLYVQPGPMPFRQESFDAVYCGHVLEHIRWENLRPFLDDLWRLMKPGAGICVVGPDIHRARAGGYHDELIHACYGDPAFDDGTGEKHLWTCTEQTVVNLLQGSFVDVQAVDIRDLDLSWPAVSHAWWQCAATARKQGTLVP